MSASSSLKKASNSLSTFSSREWVVGGTEGSDVFVASNAGCVIFDIVLSC